jgi:hypothetical protein
MMKRTLRCGNSAAWADAKWADANGMVSSPAITAHRNIAARKRVLLVGAFGIASPSVFSSETGSV